MYVKLGVMLTDTGIKTAIRDEISQSVYDMFDEEFYMNIIHNKSLITYSSYYPALMPPLRITKDMGIPEQDPFTGKMGMCRYQIPNYNSTLYTYIGLHDYYFPTSDMVGSFRPRGCQPGIQTVNLLDQLNSLIPHVQNPYTVEFEFPNYLIVSPPPRNHIDFVAVISYRKNLSQIPIGHFETFVGLVVADTKLTIYNMLPNLRNSGTFGGVEIESVVSTFQDAKSDRENIIEQWEKDWYKDPVHYSTTTLYQKY